MLILYFKQCSGYQAVPELMAWYRKRNLFSCLTGALSHGFVLCSGDASPRQECMCWQLVSTDNYTSGVFLSSHLIWASQLISLHLSFPACKTDNHVGTTQHGLIEVLASPRPQRHRGFFIWSQVKRCFWLVIIAARPPAASAHPWDVLGHLPAPPCCGSELWETLLKIAVLAFLFWMLQFIWFSFF